MTGNSTKPTTTHPKPLIRRKNSQNPQHIKKKWKNQKPFFIVAHSSLVQYYWAGVGFFLVSSRRCAHVRVYGPSCRSRVRGARCRCASLDKYAARYARWRDGVPWKKIEAAALLIRRQWCDDGSAWLPTTAFFSFPALQVIPRPSESKQLQALQDLCPRPPKWLLRLPTLLCRLRTTCHTSRRVPPCLLASLVLSHSTPAAASAVATLLMTTVSAPLAASAPLSTSGPLRILRPTRLSRLRWLSGAPSSATGRSSMQQYRTSSTTASLSTSLSLSAYAMRSLLLAATSATSLALSTVCATAAIAAVTNTAAAVASTTKPHLTQEQKKQKQKNKNEK